MLGAALQQLHAGVQDAQRDIIQPGQRGGGASRQRAVHLSLPAVPSRDAVYFQPLYGPERASCVNSGRLACAKPARINGFRAGDQRLHLADHLPIYCHPRPPVWPSFLRATASAQECRHTAVPA